MIPPNRVQIKPVCIAFTLANSEKWEYLVLRVMGNDGNQNVVMISCPLCTDTFVLRGVTPEAKIYDGFPEGRNAPVDKKLCLGIQ